MSSRRVTVIGGSGFVGTQLVYRLSTVCDEVVVLTRRAQRVRDFRTVNNVAVVEVNVHDPKALSAAIQGSTVVINLVGILNEGGSREETSFENAHYGLTKKIVEACNLSNITRYLHMSALNADAEKGSSAYLRTKGKAEQVLRNNTTGLQWTIFQPSIIFGEHDAFFNRFAGLLKLMPIFPLAVPEAKMAPVYVGDVCQIMVDAMDNPSAIGATIPLCGPEEYSLRELVEYTAKASNMKRVIVGLPDWAARLQARVMEFVPGKPFTRDNYLSLQTDSICDCGTQRQTTSLDAVVPRYLGNADWAGRLQKRRTKARR